jgi:hypothetical protein
MFGGNMRTAILALMLFPLTACGSNKEDNQVTETRMDDLDSLEGTISDDMINTDELADEAPVEAAPAPTGKAPPKEDDTSADKADEPAPAETADKADSE